MRKTAMINTKKETIDTVISNIESSIDYYLNQHRADISGASRIRNDATIVKGLFDYREALINLQKENAPAKKRGNPNFGKHNPYNTKQEVKNDG